MTEPNWTSNETHPRACPDENQTTRPERARPRPTSLAAATALPQQAEPSPHKTALVAILPHLRAIPFQAATQKEREQIVRTLLETAYLDGGVDGPVVGIEPKAAYRVLLELM